MDKFVELLKDGVIYQFVVLFALVVFDGICLVTTKTLEPTITGAIIGLAIGIPSSKGANKEVK